MRFSTEAIIRRGDTDDVKRRQGGDIKELFAWFEYWLRYAAVQDLRFCQEAPGVDVFSLLTGSYFQASSVQFYDVDLSESAKCPFEEILNDNFNGLNTLMFHSKNVSSPFFTDHTLSTISNKGIVKVSVTGVKPAHIRFYDLDEDELLDSLMKCLRYRVEPFHIELSHVRVSTTFVTKFMKVRTFPRSPEGSAFFLETAGRTTFWTADAMFGAGDDGRPGPDAIPGFPCEERQPARCIQVQSRKACGLLHLREALQTHPTPL